MIKFPWMSPTKGTILMDNVQLMQFALFSLAMISVQKKKRSLFILNDNLGKIHVLTCF